MRVAHSFINVYKVVEVTMNMAEYGSQRSKQPENVNLEDLKVIFLTETKCKIRFIYVIFHCTRKNGEKMEGKKCH